MGRGRTTQAERRNVISKVQSLVNDEPKECPLTDHEISMALAAEGINLTTNGVWQWRRKLEIPSSKDRTIRRLQWQIAAITKGVDQ